MFSSQKYATLNKHKCFTNYNTDSTIVHGSNCGLQISSFSMAKEVKTEISNPISRNDHSGHNGAVSLYKRYKIVATVATRGST